MTMQPVNPADRAGAIVDDALRTQPLRPAPPGLSGAVMATLREQGSAAAWRPTFRLAWMDYALCVFGCLAAYLVVTFWRLISPEEAQRLWAQMGGPLLQTYGLQWVLALPVVLVALGLMVLAAIAFRPPRLTISPR